jgi:choline dehydrogenase-like flavoprotein
MKSVVIVGSGASGVHFALSLLRKGYHVEMLDVGWERPAAVNPGDTWLGLKKNLKDPVSYFLGENFEAVVLPEVEGEYYTKYYGFPPSKNQVFMKPDEFGFQANGFVPLFSFGQGGLAEAWTGGAYSYNENDLAEYPFSYSEIEPFYGEVARRIGLNGEDDDMARFFPFHANLLAPLRLDLNSQLILDRYQKSKTQINEELNSYLGRSRVTTLSVSSGDREACSYSGRCLWGCPTKAFYTPSLTLQECKQYPHFEYHADRYVTHFSFNGQNRLECIYASGISDLKEYRYKADYYVLAAGALSSSKIFMDSIYRATGEVIKLPGLMDNRQILVPFFNMQMLGKTYENESYQYHQLAVGLQRDRPEEYIHGQITTLKTALVHPVIQNVPFDLNTSSHVFRDLRSGLGVVNLNLFDRRREENYLTIQPKDHSSWTTLEIHYSPIPGEKEIINDALRRTKKLLWKLRCIVPPSMIHIRPMGASVHYTGTIPMSSSKAPFSTNKYCQSNDFQNLYIVDGTTMPFLPSKNITFTLMANAVRVAESVF